MRGGGKHDDDWSHDAQSLFQAARFDHEANTADKARVQEALALRLSERAAEAASVTRGAARIGQRSVQWIRSSGLVRLVLSAVGIAAVSTLSLQVMQRPKQQPVDSPVAASTHIGTTGAPAAQAPTQIGAQGSEPSKGSAAPTSSLGPADAPLRRATVLRTPPKTEPRSRTRPRSAAVSAGMHAAESRHAPGATGATVEAKVVLGAAASDGAPLSEPAVGPSAPPSTPLAAPQEAPPHQALAGDAREELTLVERIQAALRAHQSALALELCNEHERRWPRGTFVEEREGIRAFVACSTRAKNADARARSFLAAHPHTPLAHRVAAACALQLPASGAAPADLGAR